MIQRSCLPCELARTHCAAILVLRNQLRKRRNQSLSKESNRLEACLSHRFAPWTDSFRGKQDAYALLIQASEDFWIAYVRPVARKFQRFHLFARPREIAHGIGHFIFAARRRPQSSREIETAAPNGVETRVVPRAFDLPRVRFCAHLVNFPFSVQKNRD